MGPLHFGHFAGLLSKIVWIALGLATCYVTLTGLQLWIARRKDEPGWRWLEVAVPMFGYGVPIAMAGSAFGFLATYPAGDTVSGTANGFIVAAVLAVAIALLARTPRRTAQMLQALLGLMLVALPIVRLAMGGAGWPALIDEGQLIPVTIDLVLLVAGAFALIAIWRQIAKPVDSFPHNDTNAEPELAPAE
jgi:hypothetical protein